jgi:hypothetical protein
LFFRVDPGGQRVEFFAPQFAHLGIVAVHHFLGLRALVDQRVIFAIARDDGLELRIFHRELAELVGVGDDVRIGEQGSNFFVTLDEFFEFVADRIFH